MHFYEPEICTFIISFNIEVKSKPCFFLLIMCKKKPSNRSTKHQQLRKVQVNKLNGCQSCYPQDLVTNNLLTIFTKSNVLKKYLYFIIS